MNVKPQRLEYVEQTRQALLAAAEQLFITQGFRATSIDAVGAAARFTKGAVYRHFADKQALFLAVFERVEIDTVAELTRRAESAEGPVEAAEAALRGFLEIAPEPRFRRIVLEEGSVALGLRRWRELDHAYTAALLERLLSDLIDAGELPPTPVRPLARMCCAVVGEAAIQLVDADADEQSRNEVLAALDTALAGFGRRQDTMKPA